MDRALAADWPAAAVAEARAGLADGGIPIGAALYGAGGELLGRGRNRRVQDGGLPRALGFARAGETGTR